MVALVGTAMVAMVDALEKCDDPTYCGDKNDAWECDCGAGKKCVYTGDFGKCS